MKNVHNYDEQMDIIIILTITYPYEELTEKGKNKTFVVTFLVILLAQSILVL